MRRNLIKWEAFERIQKDSLSTAEYELCEASEVLSKVLGIDQLDLNCYSESNVVYETLDGTYVRADYDLAKDHLTLENIEELVIDEDTAAQASKKKVAEMVDAILENQNEKASQIFSEYMSSPIVRKILAEGRDPGFRRPKAESRRAGNAKKKSKNTSRVKNQGRKLDSAAPANVGPRDKRNTNKGPSEDPLYQHKYWKSHKGKTFRNKIDADGNVKKVRNMMKECLKLSHNVREFVEHQEFGPVLSESLVRKDHVGNVVAVRIPTSRVRNENRILTINHRHQIDNGVRAVREEAHGLSRSPSFAKAVAELKRHNNLSDNEALRECLQALVGQWPSVLYLSQTELARTVAESLQMVGVSNYGDQDCVFLAEGILRTAHETFGDRVEKILHLAQADLQVEGDNYVHFQNVAHKFFPTLDESLHTQMRVFNDLFNAVNGVWENAHETNDTELANYAESVLDSLAAVVNGEAEPDLVLAQDVADWLNQYAESNLEGGEWQVSNTPYVTISGDHPAMAEKARQSYSPAGDFGADAEAWQRRATEKQFTGPQWTSVGGGEIFPGLNNPYVPKPFGDYTMSGEKGVDKDWQSGEGSWNSGDTYPNLQNPYVPKAETPKSYQMKNGTETDLVVNK